MRRATPAERRELTRQIVKDEGWIPVEWSTEANAYVATEEPRFYKVACPHCGRRYSPNQRHYMSRHVGRIHGLEVLKEMWDRSRAASRARLAAYGL